MRILQDFKLINGDGVGEILLELHFPEGALVEKAVNDRMANHFDNKGAQGVRVIDSDTGKVIYKQTWWDERMPIGPSSFRSFSKVDGCLMRSDKSAKVFLGCYAIAVYLMRGPSPPMGVGYPTISTHKVVTASRLAGAFACFKQRR